MIWNKKKLVTHNGSFHADDLFATAFLALYFKGKIKIIRTRDSKKIAKGDIVYDLGGIYDAQKNKFDHHQQGGAGKRENGIEYSSFGLVWKQFGLEFCDNDLEVWKIIDDKIVAPIDAIDNGIDIIKPIFDGVIPYDLEQAFLVYSPTWEENNINIDKIFKKQVKMIKVLLEREINVAKSEARGKKIILDYFKNSSDKRIIISETSFPRYLFQKVLSELTEPIYFICPSGHSEKLWKVESIHKNSYTMDGRKLFPESWRGYFGSDQKQKEIIGISDITFCHRNGFLTISKSKEGAIKLAQIAVESN